MNRLESWLLHLSTLALGVTGFVYAWMKYMMKPVDPFSVVNHPWQPHLLSAHILVAPVLLLAVGIILHGHIVFKISSGARTAKRSGLILIPIFIVMVVSGYLLQVITSDFRKALVVVHLVSGALWSLMYLGHQLASYSQRRMKANGRSAFRIPVQMILLMALLGSFTILDASPFEREVYSMGTTLRILMLEEEDEKALLDSEVLIRVVEETERQLSTWKSDSELSMLNRAPTGSDLSVSRSLFDLIGELQRWNVLTRGAFDPGIGRLLETWDVHGSFRIPSENEIRMARHVCGLQYIRRDLKSGTITKEKNILIDPGGFGKGEALDRAIKLAESRKMAPLLMDFGGQIAVHGSPALTGTWKAFLAQSSNRFMLTNEKLDLEFGSLSTSGFSERSGNAAGQRVHHILNPGTGRPVEAFGAVTVWHSSALVADILSTALIVMGPDSGYQWSVENDIAAAFILEQKVVKTPQFIRRFAPTVTPQETKKTKFN